MKMIEYTLTVEQRHNQMYNKLDLEQLKLFLFSIFHFRIKEKEELRKQKNVHRFCITIFVSFYLST